MLSVKSEDVSLSSDTLMVEIERPLQVIVLSPHAHTLNILLLILLKKILYQ